MGPRPFSRGDVFVSLVNGIRPAELQWGHGLSAVETGADWSALKLPNLLQWGHGLSAVETSTTDEREVLTAQLQWGHGLSAVETWQQRIPSPWSR